ncbi:hypothetical protein BGZ63DRAFT_427656 [Mariannaea sp. PMI_226]|nr:hypothetical protein BGZ63DRAFT_427656 [Mariannaea sp. PMI_226]
MTTAEDAAAWEALPVDEARSVWDETERNFWANQERENQTTDHDIDKTYHKTVTDIKVDLSHLSGRRALLVESQERLAKELAKVEEELARVAQACDEKVDRLNKVEQEYRDGQQTRLQNRQKVKRTMRAFFKEKRGEDPDADDGEDYPVISAERVPLRPLLNGTPTPAVAVAPAEPIESPAAEETRMEGIELQNGNHAPSDDGAPDGAPDVMVDVVDADGNVIGPVQRIEPWNQWVEAIQDLEIRRPVKIRRGRRFNEAHLATIYERTEAKGVKWLSCMIQATGQIQTKRCQSCDKNQGAFDDCIIVGGELFQKCGNCEWNRQGCHGASGDYIDLPASRRQHRRSIRNVVESPIQPERPLVRLEPTPEGSKATERERKAEQEPVEQQHELKNPRKESSIAALLHPLPLALPSQAPPPKSLPIRSEREIIERQADRAQPSTEIETPMKNAPTSNRNGPITVHEPEQMPTPQDYRVTPGFTAANAAQRSRPSSADRPTPTSIHIEPSPQPSESFVIEEIEEITRATLALKDNGTVYTFPECVEGVPLEKIDEKHPYWEPSWPDVRSLIEPQLERWREKHVAAIEAGARQEKGGSSKYQIGRQVNRGIKILEFLDEGEISPYQLLSKKYISSGKGGICSYDTLFRLSETMSELAKFKLDIKPIEWMRQRLYELIQVEGSGFNLPRTIHDFYHDPKLTSLRYKHGFKNIGRPSGMKSARVSMGSPSSTPKPIKKRKSMHSLASTPRETPIVDHSPLATHVVLPTERPSSAHKRAKLSSPVPIGSIMDGYRDEFHTVDHSDTDSWSGASITKNDFRLRQVKTRRYTSTAGVTQYWTWVKEDRVFEHQVLKALGPVQWGVHKQPYNFHLSLDEISTLIWNIEALRVHVVLRKDKDIHNRGDIMAEFKRENTMRRFLSFCREQGVHLTKDSKELLFRRWDSTYSGVLLDEAAKPHRDILI